MKLKQYEYGKTRFALDISKVLYISVLGDRFIEMTFRNGNEKSIPFENRDKRDQFYEDILGDIEAINKPIVCTESYTTYMANNLKDSIMTKPTALTENPYLYTDPDLRMKKNETEIDDKRYCSTCAHFNETGWLCYEKCHNAWTPKEDE